jgi:hypothetical protein
MHREIALFFRSIESQVMEEKQMKNIITLLILSAASLCALAGDDVPCDKAGFEATVKIAAANGFKWPGKFADAKCRLTDSAAFVWSGVPSASALLAISMAEPYRVQFYRGGTTPLFCVKLIDSKWTNVGKNCDG